MTFHRNKLAKVAIQPPQAIRFHTTPCSRLEAIRIRNHEYPWRTQTMLQWVTHAKDAAVVSQTIARLLCCSKTTKGGMACIPKRQANSKLCGHKRFKALPTSKLFRTLYYTSQGPSQGLVALSVCGRHHGEHGILIACSERLPSFVMHMLRDAIGLITDDFDGNKCGVCHSFPNG